MLSFECVDVVVWLCPPLGAELRLQESFLCKPEVKLESLSPVHFRVLFLLRLVPQILLGFFFPFPLLCCFFSTPLIRSMKLKILLGLSLFLMKLCCLVSLFFLVLFFFLPVIYASPLIICWSKGLSSFSGKKKI